MVNPAENLVGQVVNGRWAVEEQIDLRSSDSTGGFFSVPYIVRDNQTGEKAFLKVLDVIKAIQRYQDHGRTNFQPALIKS